MPSNHVTVPENVLRRLIKDVALIEKNLSSQSTNEDPEGELSDWAKKELARARKTPRSEYISLEEVEKQILARQATTTNR